MCGWPNFHRNKWPLLPLHILAWFGDRPLIPWSNAKTRCVRSMFFWGGLTSKGWSVGTYNIPKSPWGDPACLYSGYAQAAQAFRKLNSCLTCLGDIKMLGRLILSCHLLVTTVPIITDHVRSKLSALPCWWPAVRRKPWSSKIPKR